MMKRCGHKPAGKKFKTYCSAGIVVCERWRTYENFKEDMGVRLKGTTLDRFPNRNGNYEPGNCRWATGIEQNTNKDSTILVTHQGQALSIAGWARKLGVNTCTLWRRLTAYRMPLERALTSKRLYTYGTRSHFSKLKEQEVKDIRSLWSSGHSYIAIAKRFSIHERNVHLIVNRKTWKRLND